MRSPGLYCTYLSTYRVQISSLAFVQHCALAISLAFLAQGRLEQAQVANFVFCICKKVSPCIFSCIPLAKAYPADSSFASARSCALAVSLAFLMQGILEQAQIKLKVALHCNEMYYGLYCCNIHDFY